MTNTPSAPDPAGRLYLLRDGNEYVSSVTAFTAFQIAAATSSAIAALGLTAAVFRPTDRGVASTTTSVRSLGVIGGRFLLLCAIFQAVAFTLVVAIRRDVTGGGWWLGRVRVSIYLSLFLLVFLVIAAVFVTISITVVLVIIRLVLVVSLLLYIIIILSH